MATLIELGDGSFAIGDPPATLDLGQHWCDYCGGSGLEYDFDGYDAMCAGCFGSCIVACADTACPTHSSLHPVS